MNYLWNLKKTFVNERVIYAEQILYLICDNVYGTRTCVCAHKGVAKKRCQNAETCLFSQNIKIKKKKIN